jgi:hypothetical protein
MSIDEDLLRKETQRYIDSALEDIENDYGKLVGPNVGSRLDFVYGYEYGYIVSGVASYYRYKILGDKGITVAEAQHLTDVIKDIVLERLPEIRQAITRAEARST